MKTGRPTKDVKKVPVSARIDPKAHKSLAAIASAQKRTISQILEFAVEEYIQRSK